jgi:hypothetical protein
MRHLLRHRLMRRFLRHPLRHPFEAPNEAFEGLRHLRHSVLHPSREYSQESPWSLTSCATLYPGLRSLAVRTRRWSVASRVHRGSSSSRETPTYLILANDKKGELSESIKSKQKRKPIKINLEVQRKAIRQLYLNKVMPSSSPIFKVLLH